MMRKVGKFWGHSRARTRILNTGTFLSLYLKRLTAVKDLAGLCIRPDLVFLVSCAQCAGRHSGGDHDQQHCEQHQ